MNVLGDWARGLEPARGLLLAAAIGCASAARPVAPQAASPQLEPALELAPHWPRPQASADAERRAVLLRAPRPRDAAERVIDGFFEAVRRESVADLTVLASEDATVESGPGSVPEPLSKVWAARFKRLDYGHSGAETPYRPGEVALFSTDELHALAAVRTFELEPGPAELLAVVTTRDRRRQLGPRHFGRRLEFLLGEGERGLVIRRMFEDFQLP